MLCVQLEQWADCILEDSVETLRAFCKFFHFFFWVLISCGRLSWLLLAYECTVHIVHCLVSFLSCFSAGTYSSVNRSTECLPCPQGYSAPVPGSANCAACDPGTNCRSVMSVSVTLLSCSSIPTVPAVEAAPKIACRLNTSFACKLWMTLFVYCAEVTNRTSIAND